jgi:hypothetical protein
MAVPPQLLQQLLALDESVRLEIAHALLESVDPADDDGMSDAEREKLHASIERSLAQSDAGQGIPVEQAIAALRARRAARARGIR